MIPVASSGNARFFDIWILWRVEGPVRFRPVQEPNQTWYISSYGSLLVSLWQRGRRWWTAASMPCSFLSIWNLRSKRSLPHVETCVNKVVIQCPMPQNIYISIASLVPLAAPVLGSGDFFTSMGFPHLRNAVEWCMIWICLKMGYLQVWWVVITLFPL